MNELRERIVNYIPYDEQEESDKEYILKFIDTFDDVFWDGSGTMRMHFPEKIL